MATYLVHATRQELLAAKMVRTPKENEALTLATNSARMQREKCTPTEALLAASILRLPVKERRALLRQNTDIHRDLTTKGLTPEARRKAGLNAPEAGLQGPTAKPRLIEMDEDEQSESSMSNSSDWAANAYDSDEDVKMKADRTARRTSTTDRAPYSGSLSDSEVIPRKDRARIALEKDLEIARLTKALEASVLQQQLSQYDDPSIPLPQEIVLAGGQQLVTILQRRDAVAAARAANGNMATLTKNLNIHTDPLIDWTSLSNLDFADLPSIFPWFREFERVCDIAGCSEEQTLANLKKYPSSTPGTANAAAARLSGKETTYLEVRNRLIRELAHPESMLHLFMLLQKAAMKVRSTASWREAIRNKHTELKMVLEAYSKDSPEKLAKLERNLAVYAIDPFPAQAAMKLLNKLKGQKLQQGALEFILQILPEKWGNGGYDQVNVCSAQMYRPSARQHPGPNARGNSRMRRGRGGGRGGRLPGNGANLTPLGRTIVKNVKRVDVEGRMCQCCGETTCSGRKTCKAYGTQCKKCKKYNHFSQLCRGNTAVIESTKTE